MIIFSAATVIIFLLAASSETLKPIIKVAYFTGMRQGEILNLKW